MQSLTFSATTKHEMTDYDGSKYWFDIDDLGSSTITSLTDKPARTQNNLIECQKQGNEISCSTNDRTRSLVGLKDHIRLEVTLDIDYDVTTDKLILSLPPSNVNY